MSQVYSVAAALVNGANNTFSPSESEGYAKKGGRVFARATANTVLTPLALIETVVFAAFAVITSPLALLNKTRPAFEWAKNHTLVAANATKNAAAGIIGRGEVAKKEVPAKTKWEAAKEKAHEFAAKAMNFASEKISKVNRNYAVGSAVLTSIVLAGYHFNLLGMAYNGSASALSTAGTGLYDAGSWAVEKGGNALSFAQGKLPSVSLPSFFGSANATVANVTAG